MISEKTIRQEEFLARMEELKEIIGDMAMTFSQSTQLNQHIYELERIFSRANNN